MDLDYIVRGGKVVDGTGSAASTADIGIKNGRIAAIGRISETARQEIDATGAIVTPGFIDAHTHYDGQAVWDEDMAPSSRHGVTTAVMGNCGVGFAPIKQGKQDVLINLMEGVEDIPGTALSEGLDWSWESFPEYLDRLEKKTRTLNLMTQVPHDPIRLYVMGERAQRREPATAKDIAEMRDLVRQALEAGAWAFSTGRTDGHRMSDGNDTPSSIANENELVGIASALRGLPYRTLSAVSDFDQALGPESFDAEFDLLEKMAEAAGC
jgi:N-acyl-D-aspartate/D-glutamate deacylase